MAFLSSAAAALGGRLLCREQPTLTLSSSQEHFPSLLFSFGITFIRPFVSIVQLSQFSLTDSRDFFFSDALRSIFNWKNSPCCNPSSWVFPTNLIGTVVWWALLLMEMLVSVGSQHHWNILCFVSVQWELFLQLCVQSPFRNSVHGRATHPSPEQKSQVNNSLGVMWNAPFLVSLCFIVSCGWEKTEYLRGTLLSSHDWGTLDLN